MENNKMELNLEEMELVSGAGLLDLVGEGIGYLFEEFKDKIEDYFGTPDDGKCTGEQVMPGFNVY